MRFRLTRDRAVFRRMKSVYELASGNGEPFCVYAPADIEYGLDKRMCIRESL